MLRRLLPFGLLTLTLPAVVVALPVVTAPAPSPHPVATHDYHVPVTAAAITNNPSAASNAEPGPAHAALTQPATAQTSTKSFRMVGVSWRYDSSISAVTAQVRVHSNGQWTAWQALSLSDPGPDNRVDRSGGKNAAAPREGTDPLWVDQADGVQARIVSYTGDQPQDVRVDLIDPGTSAADATVARKAPASSALAATTQPQIYTRADWGADESIRLNACPSGPEYTGAPKVAFVHHTVTGNGYAAADVPGIIRSIYAYHVQGEGWCDIGYNFLVDAYGRIWEGRYGGIDKAVLGAHTGGFNTNSFGVSMIGTYDTVSPPAALTNALAQLIAWKLSLSYADPTGTTSLTASSFSGSRYAAGQTVALNVISGHRDVDLTACPGAAGYAILPGLRQQVRSIMGAGLVTPNYSVDLRTLSRNGSLHLTAGMLQQGSWQLVVDDASGNPVRTINGSGSSIDTTWNFDTDSGSPVPAGQYTLNLTSTQTSGAARPWTSTVLVGGVFGNVDDASSPSSSTAEIRGWALNGSNDNPASVRVTVNGSTATTTQADGSRPDVASVYPGYSTSHGFDVTLGVPSGNDNICVYGQNTALSAGDTLLGCRVVSVGAPFRVLSGQAANPIGNVDSITTGPTSVHVRGWALDPETTASISVAVSVDTHIVGYYQAAVDRPDIGAAYGGYGPNHGFDQVINGIVGGTHTVCVYGMNVMNGTTNPQLACTQVTVPTGPPLGSYDSAAMTAPGQVLVRGWALDPDTTGPVRVDIYVDNHGAASIQANATRSDIGRLFPDYGAAHGFQTTLSLPGGTHSICAFAINAGPASNNVLLGCRTVTLPTGAPFGSYDAATMTTPGQVLLRGWAIDPDTTGPVRIDVYVDNVGATSVQADGSRPDVGSIYGVYGNDHGFQTTLSLGGGKHSICVFAINVGPAASNRLLGCRSVTMPTGAPLGSFDSATGVGGGQIQVRGWAIDPDTAGAIRVDFYVDGKGATSATADVSRADIGAAFPLYGPDHGFDTTFAAAPGKHQVCAYAINVGGGAASTKLACLPVTVS